MRQKHATKVTLSKFFDFVSRDISLCSPSDYPINYNSSLIHIFIDIYIICTASAQPESYYLNLIQEDQIIT